MERVVPLPAFELDSSLKIGLTANLLGKFVLFSTTRAFYPYAPYLITAFGLTPNQYSVFLFVGELMGLFNPLQGLLVDRFGSSPVLLTSLGLLSLCTFGVLLGRNFTTLILVQLCFGNAKNMYVIAVQAYVSDHVPTAKIGKYTGVMELAWGLAGLLGLPLFGILLDAYGWQAPYILFGSLYVPLLMVLMVNVMKEKKSKQRKYAETVALVGVSEATESVGRMASPGSEAERFPKTTHEIEYEPSQSISGTDVNDDVEGQKHARCAGLRTICSRPDAVSILVFIFFQGFAMNLVFANYGKWLVQDYAMTPSKLGAFTATIGAGEILAELVVAGVSDRIGHLRMLVIGAVLSFLSYGTFMAVTMVGAVVPLAFVGTILFLCFLFFEVGLVLTLAVSSTLMPPSIKGTFIGFYFSAFVSGLTLSAATAELLWSAFGMQGLAVVPCCLSFLSVLALLPVMAKVRREDHAKKAAQQISSNHCDINSLQTTATTESEL